MIHADYLTIARAIAWQEEISPETRLDLASRLAKDLADRSEDLPFDEVGFIRACGVRA